ncbi:hypothetical protein ACWX0K_20470 [Nitrobacteraceae bacterium UC4446_H13]
MTITLPNPFQFESAPTPSRAGQLTAHVDHAAVLSIPVLRASPAGSQEVVAPVTSPASAAASTSISGLDVLTAAWVFGSLRSELAKAVRDINSHIALRSFASNSITSFSGS